jgi:hypothetical protein
MAHTLESLKKLYHAQDLVVDSVEVERGFIYDPSTRGYTEGFHIFTLKTGLSLNTEDAIRVVECIIGYLNSEEKNHVGH